jgi:hypothetical protein
LSLSIIIDSREQKTPRLMEYWTQSHPQLAKTVHYSVLTCKVGDVLSPETKQLFSIKWGADLESSLNTGHLADECRRIREFCLESGWTSYLVLADTMEFHMNLILYDRAVQIAQEYGLWIKRRSSVAEGFELLMNLVQKPKKQIELNIPVVKSKKRADLVLGLSMLITGISIDFWEFALPESDQCKSLKDILTIEKSYWNTQLSLFYKKNMQHMYQLICQKIYGEST